MKYVYAIVASFVATKKPKLSKRISANGKENSAAKKTNPRYCKLTSTISWIDRMQIRSILCYGLWRLYEKRKHGK